MFERAVIYVVVSQGALFRAQSMVANKAREQKKYNIHSAVFQPCVKLRV